MFSQLIFGLCLTISGIVSSAEPEPPKDSLELILDIKSVIVGVNSPPVTTFNITYKNGETVLLSQDDIADGSLRFGLAKLVPGNNGNADSWQSYINQTEVADPDVGPGGAAVLKTAMQATVEARGNAGTLTRNADETYTYQFATDITDPSQTMGVTYQPSLTHRMAMQVELEGRDGKTISINPYFDFVPNGGSVTVNKRVVHKDSCNSCHQELALHGGGRTEMEYCVVCHNPGTTDANSGNLLDFSPMVHKIHMGEELSEPYTIWGYRDSEHDYSTVVYPQDHRNCSKCHSAENDITPEGDNWKMRPTMNSCGACHDGVDFGKHFGGQKDNSKCAECHMPNSSSSAIAIENAHSNPGEVLAEHFRFNILAVNFNPGTAKVTVDFSVTDPTKPGYAYDIHGEGVGASRMSVLIGWNAAEINNAGSGSAPGLPISINPMLGKAFNIGNNVFRVSADLPIEATGTGVVALEGSADEGGVRVPVANVVEYFAIEGDFQPRREIVSIDKCNACHGNLSLHGNNRQGSVEVCVICHNPNATDMEVRPASLDSNGDGVFDDFTALGIDGLREESIHFKTMIHGIHAGTSQEHGMRKNGIVVYGYRRSVHDYSHVRYPGILSNCNACHVNESYQIIVPEGALATTVETASPSLDGYQSAIEKALHEPADDLNISPETASCVSCHDSAEAIDHMKVEGGGSFEQTQDVITNMMWEDCGGCHGPHEFKDVREVHGLR